MKARVPGGGKGQILHVAKDFDASMRLTVDLTSPVRLVTCREAAELCKKPGARIFWRPNGVVNWMLPELDRAEVLEG